MADPVEEVHFKRQQELDAVQARIDASQQLILEQEARISQMREQGVDLRPSMHLLSMHLLRQFQFSLRLLSDTREIIRREIAGEKSPGARVDARQQLKAEEG